METGYTKKYKELTALKDSVDVLILGNSHAQNAVDPREFRNFTCFNLAYGAQKIYFDKRLTYKFLKKGMPKLKYVFISVDYHSLYTSSQKIRNVWSYYAHGIKYKNNNYLKERLSPFLWGYTPKAAISMIKKKILNKSTNNTYYRGFVGHKGTNKIFFSKERLKQRAKSFDENPSNSERKEVIEDLKDFITNLKNRNITPILFSTPTFSEYNKFLNQETIEKNKKDIKAICKEFDIQYWRYNEDERFNLYDFYNQDHLNLKGAKKFSNILYLRLLDYDRTRSQRKSK